MPNFDPKIDDALKDQAIMNLRDAVNGGHITETQRNAAIDANASANLIAKFARALDGSIEDRRAIITDMYDVASDSVKKNDFAGINSRETIANLELGKLNVVFEKNKPIILEILNTIEGDMRRYASLAAGSDALAKGEFIQSLLQHYDLKTDYGSHRVIVDKDNTQEGPNPGYALPKAVTKSKAGGLTS